MTQAKQKLLIIDDDPGIQKQLKWSFTEYEALLADDRASAISQLKLHQPSVVTLDLGLPPDPANASEGLATLAEIISIAPNTKVIVITGNDDRENAMKAIALGACDFFQKPIEPAILGYFIERAFHIYQLEEENRLLQQYTPTMSNIIGNSPAMQKVCRMVERIAATDITTLLLGESGTGKEVLAKAIHQLSPRKEQPFIAINCASIPDNLLESELFGFERGAFTGAHKQTKGKIECANGGTLFLDEIGDMPLALQAKMLRFLQERIIERVGGRNEIEVDIRVLCATHRDLVKMTTEETFREDLYYRINEICINIPSLKQRDGDIILLARTFLRQYNHELNRKIKGFTNNALDAMLAYAWPGNIRELQNKLKSAVIMADSQYIDEEDLCLNISDSAAPQLALRDIREAAERRAIITAISYCNKNMSRTAEQLGITRPTLYSLMEKYKLGELKTG